MTVFRETRGRGRITGMRGQDPRNTSTMVGAITGRAISQSCRYATAASEAGSGGRVSPQLLVACVGSGMYGGRLAHSWLSWLPGLRHPVSHALLGQELIPSALRWTEPRFGCLTALGFEHFRHHSGDLRLAHRVPPLCSDGSRRPRVACSTRGQTSTLAV